MPEWILGMNYSEWSKCFQIFASYEPDETGISHDSYSLFIGNVHPTNMKAEDVEYLSNCDWEWNEGYGCWERYV